MFTQILLLPGAIAELFASASNTGRLTLADRYGLLAAILDDSLSEEERDCIDRLLRSAVRGRLEIADDLSVVLQY